MPSAEHELPLVLIRDAADVFITLLIETLGLPIGEFASADPYPSDTVKVPPVTLNADRVILAKNKNDQAVAVVIVDVPRQGVGRVSMV